LSENGKKSPEGKKNERKKDIQEDNKNDIHRKHFDSVTER
jgi:hypothetical protein